MSDHRDAHVWGAGGGGRLGVYLQRTGKGTYGLGLVERRPPNRAERRGGRADPIVEPHLGAAHLGAELTRDDLTRLRARIDEVLQEETHDGRETA